MSLLFSPFQLGNVVLRNRIVVSPMCQYSATDGFAANWHLVHLGTRAVGGAGLIMQEATAVSPEGRISDADLGIWKDEHIEKLREICSFLHAQGAVAGIQLAHAGRKASAEVPWKGGRQITSGIRSWQTIAPSAVPYHETDNIPLEMSLEDIARVIADFRQAAIRALDAGYKVIELHAAHGYLIHQFYSPYSNKRTDEYGGSFDNRIRFLLDIIAAVQSVWPADRALIVRISATDWKEGAWTIDDSVALARVLREKGVDLVDTSSAANVSGVKIPVGPGYQVPFAAQIRAESGMPTGAVGLITTAQQAETILQEGKADLIFLARQMLRDPYFPLHAAQELNDTITWPPQYERAQLQTQ